MKRKLIQTILAAGMVFSLSTAAMAASSQIGVVDTQAIIQNSTLYSELRKAENELANLQQSFEKDYMDKMQKLQGAIQQKKSPAEIQKLQEQYKKELVAKQTNAQKVLGNKQKSLETLRNNLRKKVEAAIKDIAKQKKLDYVVDKQAMFFGGTDITGDVLKRIK